MNCVVLDYSTVNNLRNRSRRPFQPRRRLAAFYKMFEMPPAEHTSFHWEIYGWDPSSTTTSTSGHWGQHWMMTKACLGGIFLWLCSYWSKLRFVGSCNTYSGLSDSSCYLCSFIVLNICRWRTMIPHHHPNCLSPKGLVKVCIPLARYLRAQFGNEQSLSLQVVALKSRTGIFVPLKR